MQLADVARQRLRNHGLDVWRHDSPRAVVAALGAVQAQEYRSALWAIGARLTNGDLASVERAIADREIVRTWPMRGTLHFVAAADVRWMLALCTPRVIAGMAGRARQLALDPSTFARAGRLLERALAGGRQLTRDAMYDVLERGGIATAGQRGYHVLCRLAQEGVICSAAHVDGQQTFALLDEWVPPAPSLAREDALAELARRYFTSHGPATAHDFAYWSGLAMADVRAAIALASDHLVQVVVDGTVHYGPSSSGDETTSSRVHLLPAFDEYILGYRDRGAVLAPEHAPRIVPGANGVFLPTILLDGRVVGTWKRTVRAKGVRLTPTFFQPLGQRDRRALRAAAEEFGRFTGEAVSWDEGGEVAPPAATSRRLGRSAS